MSDSTPETKSQIAPRAGKPNDEIDETPADAVAHEPAPALIEPSAAAEPVDSVAPVAVTPVAVTTVEATPAEPVAATTDPAAVETAAPVAETSPSPHVLYVEAPHPPRVRGNRGVGSLMALVSAVVFAALYAVIIFLGEILATGAGDFTFISNAAFWAPTVLFALGFVILVVIVNRGGWGAHVIGSLIVGVFVYFATAGAFLLINLGTIPLPEAGADYRSFLGLPLTIGAGLLAREISLWVGFAIAHRGRRVKARNLEAREAYDREFNEKRAAYERENLARRDAAAGFSGETAPTIVP